MTRDDRHLKLVATLQLGELGSHAARPLAGSVVDRCDLDTIGAFARQQLAAHGLRARPLHFIARAGTLGIADDAQGFVDFAGARATASASIQGSCSSASR